MTKQETREVARPLRTLEKLIKEAIEAGEQAGMAYYKAAGTMLNEAQENHFTKNDKIDVSRFWKWAERNFGKSRNTLRAWMAAGARDLPKRLRTLDDVKEKVFGHRTTERSNLRRDWVNPVDEVAEKARAEAFRLARQDALSRQQERDAEEKLGLRLIDIGYKVLARELHPDRGGSREAMQRLVRVRDRLKANV